MLTSNRKSRGNVHYPDLRAHSRVQWVPLPSIRYPIISNSSCLTLGLAISFSASEIAIGAVMMNNTIFNFNIYFIFNALGVAAASLTLLTLPAMYALTFSESPVTSIVNFLLF